MGIFIVRTDYFINVLSLIQKEKKKTVVTNTSEIKKFFWQEKDVQSFFQLAKLRIL